VDDRQLTQTRHGQDIVPFVTSRVYYCGSLLIGVSKKMTDKLQHVLNAAARVVFSTHKYD